MKEFRGVWFPPEERHMIEVMQAEGDMLFAGAGVFQFRKFAAAFPLIRNFRHAVDIGAHVGTWSRVLARCFHRVTAFEPMPDHRVCFLRNIHPDDVGHVHLHPCALGDHEGWVELRNKPSSTGTVHVVEDGPGDVRAPLRTLDSLDLADVDFIKIDVEGYEIFVVEGAEQTIRKYRPTMIVEQKPTGIGRYGQADQPQALKLLQAWGAKVAFEWSGDYCVRWKS